MAGSSDLNLLKSWNPKLSKNKQKVEKKEQEALEEERKIRQRAKEREIADLASAKSKTGLEWMYEVPKPTTIKTQKPPVTEKQAETTNIPKVSSIKKSRYDKDDPMNKFKVAKKKTKRR